VRDFLEKSQALYRRAIWDELPETVEIWVEKDALAGVTYEVTNRWDVPLMVTRGFSSETFVYEAAEAIKTTGKPTYIYYFGDWDPSGVAIPEDLVRKLGQRTSLVDLTRVAVTPEQIRRLRLPNPPDEAHRLAGQRVGRRQRGAGSHSRQRIAGDGGRMHSLSCDGRACGSHGQGRSG
jgi:hypothetical protein